MLLKKQTVWLLTMLSLVVVLSVYYITSPEQKSNELAAVKQEEKADQKETKTDTEAKDADTIISQVAGDEEFEALRLQLQDERSELKEHLNTVVATTDLPADERSEAVDQMQKLSEIAKKEEMLETLIKAMDYEDALVRADGTTVKIIVKSKKESSKSEANAIIQMVKKEIGETNFVAVEFQPTK
ncbi:SpoIIIAH-like family protein [Neobacillus sp. YX16]|jgi:stage III sporulation protein AH|uniref:SpoIIIAH-like family protein n=1 Tax=Bacillaceae TaxID=186817 RepID=UPI000BA6F9CA|nr:MULTISPECIES: SpoIIIAH-like family protein [Bacillaceae]PAE43941.1 stage III sporulation protein AH [Bacillus sp. 7884-1]TDL77122.1 SpoIIIAH-like family protein [Rhodococcus qingshengii]WHZ01681.1 SpoIIIAH-like family protein [Neobacillus sp. YX16]